MLYKYSERTLNFWKCFHLYFIPVFSIWGYFDKTVIPFLHVGSEMVRANCYVPGWLSINSYPKHGKLVKY